MQIIIVRQLQYLVTKTNVEHRSLGFHFGGLSWNWHWHCHFSLILIDIIIIVVLQVDAQGDGLNILGVRCA